MRVLAHFRHSFTVLALAATALGVPSLLRAQAEPGPLRPRPGTKIQSAPAPQEQKPTISTVTSQVLAPVTVRNGRGEMVLDLGRKDFHVFDNGIEQTINHFDLGGDPLSIALVVETSSRVEPLLPAVRKAGIVFSQTVMGPTGDAAVIGYDDAVSVALPLTADADQVQKAVEHLNVGNSGARLYDALSKAVTMLEKQPRNRRRVVLAVAEAVDTGSETKLGEVLRAAEISNVTIYSVGLSTTAAELKGRPKQAVPPEIGPPGTFPVPIPPNQPQTPEAEARQYGDADLGNLVVWIVQHASNEVHGHNPLTVASTATGGENIKTFRDRSIEDAMDQIGGELHAQYSVGYTITGQAANGYHRIKITTDRAHLKVTTRPGYYIGPPLS